MNQKKKVGSGIQDSITTYIPDRETLSDSRQIVRKWGQRENCYSILGHSSCYLVLHFNGFVIVDGDGQE